MSIPRFDPPVHASSASPLVVVPPDGTVRCPHCRRPIHLLHALGTTRGTERRRFQASCSALLDYVVLLHDLAADLKAALEQEAGL
jgi:hypothetical protein